MKKNFVLVSFLLFSISTQAQILDAIKSTVKEKTGIDLNTPVKTTHSTTTTSGSTATANNSSVNLGSLTSTQISSGLKEALNLGVTEGVKKTGYNRWFL